LLALRLTGAIETLKKNNIWVIGIDRSGEAEYTQMDFKSPAAIVIGSEGKSPRLMLLWLLLW
jgi:23S rRNA (guanosine2251-2'-O)-methyltransferase